MFMTIPLLRAAPSVVFATGLAVCMASYGAEKAAAPRKAAVARPAHKPVAPKPVEPAPPVEADAEQLETAEKVFYGVYECEFKQSVDIVASPKYKGYVDVKHLKSLWLMKPVLSSTGAIRLEDVRGETLMVQISAKSMLLNVQTGHRIVDDCVSARQRELIEAARVAKAAAASAAAASAASAAAAAPAEAASGTPVAGPAATAPTTPAGSGAAGASGMMGLPTPVSPSSSTAR